MHITILTDNQQSWYIPYAYMLKYDLEDDGHEVHMVLRDIDVPTGDILCILSCEKIVPLSIRMRNRYNIVAHSSKLPQGRGWSPMTYAVLDGENKIHTTLFEAEDDVDSGCIYAQDAFELEGNELLNRIHVLQGNMINEMIRQFAANPHPGYPQQGEGSYHRKRTPADSQLDVHKSIAEQFNLLRVVDNERYPAYFVHMGKKYILKIYDDGDV